MLQCLVCRDVPGEEGLLPAGVGDACQHQHSPLSHLPDMWYVWVTRPGRPQQTVTCMGVTRPVTCMGVTRPGETTADSDMYGCDKARGDHSRQ